MKWLENDRLVELIKWVMGSVVIVIVTLVVESGFKERETGIEEMKVYNQYVDIILKADNIEERWRLAEYFSVVTPTDRLRERWVNYQNILVPDYKRYKSLQDKEHIILNQPEIQMDSLVVIQDEQKQIGGSLISKSVEAEEHEKLGFESLLNKDINSSINHFKSSENCFNGYHQVYEIYLFLLRKKSSLVTENDWRELYREIVNKYSWKMPKEYKDKLISY